MILPPLKRHALWQCGSLPILAALLALPFSGMGQDIVFNQLPPSPSLGLVQNPFTGQWVDPFAPFDTNGLRLWGTPENPVSYNLVLNGQVAYTFNSGSDFDIVPVGSNKVVGVYLDELGAPGAYPMNGGDLIGGDLNSTTYTWLGQDSLFGSVTLASALASDTIGSPTLFTGPFAGVVSAYIGLEFYTDGQAYYGWVEVGAPASINGGWIYNYAYETVPNTPIFAGEVPEPATSGLTVLGAVVLLGSWKRLHKSC